jgi:lysozyme
MKIILLVGLFCFLLQSCTHDADKYAIKGIDVSHYQGRINWDLVAQEDIDFVFVKATEGLNYRDSIFERNWAGLEDNRLKRGAYHFFRPKVSAEWQAKSFIKLVALKSDDFPPVLDVEDLKGVSVKQLIASMKVWLDLVEQHYKAKPIIYTFSDLYNRHLRMAFPDYTFWIARYDRKAPALNKKAVFWQYTDEGSLNGIKGAVDFNIFTGNLSELDAYNVVPKSNLLQ